MDTSKKGVPLTYGDFLSNYFDEILTLEVFDVNGDMVPDTFEISESTIVQEISRFGNSFSITLDLNLQEN